MLSTECGKQWTECVMGVVCGAEFASWRLGQRDECPVDENSFLLENS
jgi:hypothetical protein